ncbi:MULTISPECIES: tRNA preQ1(34) S-adenosylmethionine ribosyltransferase-isomerase QueA [unclassified Coleofasciculus]|uniref:tRNA preQ1(34) S-adenosylmethionine ribosyltransferase-isomerase QueA n=1 Tax=unclassified Coleofasciculus TaxID=2692782 RepID=UPI0018829EC5|nr:MULTISPECIES: tRNA preQ1(34) S-adenosylmethionine ribosyltransferase-isomerase QueA [unclassified Coleofasciculus]MBE9126493.1 tRNA preQ1(34) S-adenosylmethionine ribosyltransferase-isomerase QueA [Coleofasciculus sp. LEGE 07081]MBE9149910.1 tRNA preQ1(34) S-adenosylmethionine ribosyltransferase-isomerase QueA [Coleofasciculus sp. LEGE 07092]
MDAQSQNSELSIAVAGSLETGKDSEALGNPNSQIDRLLSSYDYELPEEQIAQTPLLHRDSSRLLVIDSPTHHQHCIFRDLLQLLKPKDLLVLNNTRVIPARLYGRKSTGVPVEVLLLEERQPNCWLALVKPGRRLKVGSTILFEPHQPVESSPLGNQETSSPLPITATVVARDEATSGRLLQFDIPIGLSLTTLLAHYGQIPLPPYITNTQATPEQYQTVYAQVPGAVAAPTAGLHFTPELLKECRERGIQQASVTLHVGVGTFRPVEIEDVTHHQMHSEWLEVPPSTVEKIRATQASGGRVIAVGTTVVRALEGAAAGGELQPYCGKTELFIYPGYQWRVVEGLITNFHLPRSTLLMLVSALIGRQRLLDLYREAIACDYRFYSFGDAMLILPEARLGNAI